MKRDVLNLIQNWMDHLLECQIHMPGNPYLDGAPVCPACGVIHGRFADSVLPLVLLYNETSDEKYLKAAQEFILWTERNLLCADGLYRNDIGSRWKGISLFFAMSLGETLYRFKKILDVDTYTQWDGIFRRIVYASTGFMKDVVKAPHVNYAAGAAALYAMAYRYFADPVLLEQANYWERFCKDCVDANGLIFGEAVPPAKVTEKGCHAIDMGYALEETIPLLITYAAWLDDEEKMAFYTQRAIDHLEFLLPDGGIDNSWGTRQNKWTYWGSRTSDGMQEGFIYAADKNPVIGRAMLENFRLLKKCTVEKALYAGPMQVYANEPACLHHAFSHAKALAVCYLEADRFQNGWENAVLPRERDGIRTFQNDNLYVVTKGGWTATINACDFIFYEGTENSGGAMTLLWNRKYGPVLAGTVHRFIPNETYNMQYVRNADVEVCQTARIVKGSYSSDQDLSVKLQREGQSIVARSSRFPFEIRYTVEESGVTIAVTSGEDGEYVLPVVSQAGDSIAVSRHDALFREQLRISVNQEFTLLPAGDIRYFHPVGGLQYKQLHMPLTANQELRIKLEISNNRKERER